MRGGKRTGAGRPSGSTKQDGRNTVKQIRWTAAEWQQVESAAQTAAQTPSEFIRGATLAKVQAEKIHHP